MDRLALFDVDNTLLDRQAAFEHWAADFLVANHIDPRQYGELSSIDNDGVTPRDVFFTQVKERFGIATSLDQLLDNYHQAYANYYPTPHETIRALRELRTKGWKLGVVTNGPASQLTKLDAAHLTNEFDVICVSEIVGVRKPDVRIFEDAARRCGVALLGWMVGDTPGTDIEGGWRAGLRTIWITRGRTWSETAYRPDALATSVPQAIAIILASSDESPGRTSSKARP